MESRRDQIQDRWPDLMAKSPDPALFEGLDADLAVRWFSYFFSLPRDPNKKPFPRPHVLALYDPFAKRSLFPAGIRFSCNLYVGCAFQCAYCYTQTYRDDPRIFPTPKSDFAARFEKDLRELEALGLPPAPLHFSNSTDPLQEHLEAEHGHARYLLRRLAEGEAVRFQPIRLLTRNPSRLLHEDYLPFLLTLRSKLTVQVSLPILDAAAGRFYEPGVPSSADRTKAVARLREEGVPVTLRIDPLFPRDPLPPEFFGNRSLADAEAMPAQTEPHLRQLVRFAAAYDCRSIVYSGLKIPRNLSPRNERVLRGWRELYRIAAAGRTGLFSRNYIRLPFEYQNGELTRPIREEAQACGIAVEHCKHNLIHAREE